MHKQRETFQNKQRYNLAQTTTQVICKTKTQKANKYRRIKQPLSAHTCNRRVSITTLPQVKKKKKLTR